MPWRFPRGTTRHAHAESPRQIFSCHPDPYVLWTVAQHDAPAGLEFPQKTDDLAIREYQVGKVQHDGCAARDCVERLAELADVLDVEATADRQDDGSAVSCALNLEHRGCSERNCRSNRKRVKCHGLVQAPDGRDFASGEILDELRSGSL
jgi:hypothetical protein